MNLESAIVQLNRFLTKRIQDLSISITSGGVDNMESYKYIIGQINALEATRQELSNLLDNKEQKSEGTVIDIKPKPKEWPSKDWQKFKPRTWPKQKSFVEQLGGSEKGKPHSTKEGRIASGTRRIKRLLSADKKAEGGRIGFKKGTDKNWIQKAVNPKHKGFCTPMTKKTCTPRRKALARTFKKMGRERKAKG